MLSLTDDQKAAVAAFSAFLVSPDRELVLSGPAGVGKTTLLKHLMQMQENTTLCQVLGVKPITTWALTATTNKAAEVLQESTGIKAQTIHSLLGLRVFNDFETGTSKISRTEKSIVIEDTLIVVDECSMVDSTLYRFINEGTINCKIVYVGDHCQMAPVRETLSPVFVHNEPIHLKQIVRSQHTPEITALCTQLRETVETGRFLPIQTEPGNAAIQYLSPAEAEQEIQRVFLHDMHADARILCYTNNKVLGFNQYLRQQRGLPDQFTSGEWVVSNAMTFGLGSNKNRPALRVEQDVEIFAVEETTPYEFYARGLKYELPIYLVCTSAGTYRVAKNMDEYRGLVKELSRMKEWPAYFDLKEHIADLRPRDACTVYKAQGSTYHTVFVDLADIGTCTNPSQAARMLYVACSRATHRICFIGRLPPRFGG